jgi:hypothetical protein
MLGTPANARALPPLLAPSLLAHIYRTSTGAAWWMVVDRRATPAHRVVRTREGPTPLPTPRQVACCGVLVALCKSSSLRRTDGAGNGSLVYIVLVVELTVLGANVALGELACPDAIRDIELPASGHLEHEVEAFFAQRWCELFR